MIILPGRLMEQLYLEAEKHYPQECCGILLGKKEGDNRRAELIRPGTNAAPQEEVRNHFFISQNELMRAESYADQNGYDIIGFYHSHPDCPATPSDLDAAYAIPGVSYPIVSVVEGKAADVFSYEKTIGVQGDIFEREVMKVEE